MRQPQKLVRSSQWKSDPSKGLLCSNCRVIASGLFCVRGTEARNRIGVGGALGIAEIDLRPWLMIEISIPISAANQHRRQSRLARAADLRRDIADPESDAPVIGEV